MARDPATIIIESPAEFEQAYTLAVPIKWEQQRNQVRFAILCHRLACLKVRQLTREQAAIDWSKMLGVQIMQWVRGHERLIAEALFWIAVWFLLWASTSRGI